eukprot:2833184-Pyramimonas_sp.AAC.1
MSAPSPKPRAVPKAPWGTLLLAWHLRCAAHGELWLTEGRASRVLGQVAMWIYLSLVKSEAQQHMMKMLVVSALPALPHTHTHTHTHTCSQNMLHAR